MNTVNIILRIASIIILVILFHQFFLSKKNNTRHQKWGRVARFTGVVLAIVVIIRGFNDVIKKGEITFIYGVHLFFGLLFFIFLFSTIKLGIKVAKKEVYFKSRHRRHAKATSFFLLLTLGMGIFLVLSH